MKQTSKSAINTSGSITKILLWMFIFFLMYIPLVAVVSAAVAAWMWCVGWSIRLMGDGQVAGGIVVVLLLIAVGVFVMYPIVTATFRPFYVLYKSRNHDARIEVSEADAPQLVKLINRIAEATGNKRPKHVYVSAEANASVFFNSRFINIFLPIRKNIEIGLGLFAGMSVPEISACIAHEFGHFGQGSMRWGTVVTILNLLIKNVIGVNDRWNSMVNKLINFPWVIGGAIIYSLAMKAIGWVLYGLTIGYMGIMRFLYERIQLAYLELSRKMEYEADMVSARVAGSDNVRSFMYKLLELSDRDEVFRNMLLRLAHDGYMVPDYWNAKRQANQYITRMTGKELSPNLPTEHALSPIADRRLVVDNIYSTHPDWQSRLAAIAETNFEPQLEFPKKDEELVPKALYNKVGKHVVGDLVKLIEDSQSLTELTDAQVSTYVEKELYWYLYMPFFRREVTEFDVDSCHASTEVFDPNDTAALSAIAHYEAARADLLTAEAIVRRKIGIKRAIYDGESYDYKNLPVERIRSDYEQALARAQAIDRKICEHALAKTDYAEEIHSAYNLIFYAQTMLRDYEDVIVPARNKAIESLNNIGSNANSHQFRQVQDALENFRYALRYFAYSKMDLKAFEHYAPQIAIECLNEFAERQDMFLGDGISGNAINLVVDTAEWLEKVHNNMLSAAKMSVIDACLGKNTDNASEIPKEKQLNASQIDSTGKE